MVIASQRTAALYNIQIKKIRDGVAPGSSGLDFLSKSSEIVDWIEGRGWANNTKKVVYIALKSTLRDAGDPALKAAEDVYTEKMLQCRDEHSKQEQQQVLSEREKQLFLEWPKILKAGEKLRESVSDFFEFQEYVIFCLYTLNPPVRLDYAPMRVVERQEEAEELSGNSLVADSVVGWKFCFKEYKTANKYGTVFVDISPALQDVLEEWLELNPSGWLLCDQSGEPMVETNLATRLRAVMLKAVGKPLSCNLLRHSFISWQRRGEMSFLKQKELSEAQMHSPKMSMLYRKIR
jgi:hypothetical protein